MAYPCGDCGGNCITDVICCDNCENWFHYKCQNLLKKKCHWNSKQEKLLLWLRLHKMHKNCRWRFWFWKIFEKIGKIFTPAGIQSFLTLQQTFSKFYRRHYELVSKFNVGLKTLLHQGLSEPEFYGDLVYKLKNNVGRVDFSDQFRKSIVRYKRIGYNINIMRQSACLVFNPITVNNFASLFNCTPVGRASDSMMAPT